jgi:2-phosphosulfolactate phosphatase
LQKKNIEICLSPELIHLHDITGKSVVIVDIFRATSTIVTALANGVLSMTPIVNLEKCKSMSDKGYIIAGERNGNKEDGFELGNSPLAYLNGVYDGKKIAMTTTNGTIAIEKSKSGSSEILIGSFLNLQTTANYLLEKENDVLILCAGWKGKFNLEDSLYAGALSSKLSNYFEIEDDAIFALKNLYEQNSKHLRLFLNQASHVKRLQNQNIEKDIDFCLQVDTYTILPKLKGDELVL